MSDLAGAQAGMSGTYLGTLSGDLPQQPSEAEMRKRAAEHNRRADAIAVAREFPDALRWERADVKQPPQIIEVEDEG